MQRLDRAVGLRDRGVALGRERFAFAAEDIGHLRPQTVRHRAGAHDRRAAHRIARGRRPQQPMANSAATDAMPQPARRSGIEETGPGSETGRM